MTASRSTWYPGRRSKSLPVACPRMVACGCLTAFTILAVCALLERVKFWWTLTTV